MGLDLNWYLTGEGRMLKKLNIQPLTGRANSTNRLNIQLEMAKGQEIPLLAAGDKQLKNGIIIPFLEDQPVSAGRGTELDEGDNPSRYLRVPEYLSKYQDLAVLPVRGDSMDPTLHDGDMVVCDGGGWEGDGIYVIRTEEKAFVKRVVFTPDGYQVVSDNKMYPAYQATDENLKIIGRVRAAMIAIPGRRGGV
jgi:phage repressor protein C with HTH and peptisase S24 domain